MARRKNVKRIDPRYFLDETVNRGEEELEEGRYGPTGADYAKYHRSVTGGADADEWGKEQRRRGSPGLTGPHAVQRQGPGPEGLGGDSGISDDARDQDSNRSAEPCKVVQKRKFRRM